jgi:N,N-dimethylformamidase
MSTIHLAGYCDRFSAKPGEQLSFMINAEGVEEADVQVVRLIHGDENPDGPGFIERAVDAPINGTQAVCPQHTQVGSYVRVADPDGRLAPDGPITVWAFIWPRTPGKGRQGLLTRWSIADQGGYALDIGEGGCLEFRVGDGQQIATVQADAALVAKQWYLVAATHDPSTGATTLYQEPIENRYSNHLSKIVPLKLRAHVSEIVSVRPTVADADFLWAAAQDRAADRGAFAAQLYNGKIDRCGVVGAALSRDQLDKVRQTGAPASDQVIASWDTTAGYTEKGIGDRVVDTGPNGLHGAGCNRPVRAMTGYNWNGHDDCFRFSPAQFGGIDFHDDAMTDCGWSPTFSMAVPDLKSGVYAARLTAGDRVEHVVFFVRPKRPSAPIAMLMPTCSYLAYANERLALAYATSQVLSSQIPVIHEWDLELQRHPEYGVSCYDSHGDGAGVCYSTRLRPILNMRPTHRMAGTVVPWQFPADLSVIYWLETQGYDYDVITDEDLHREGEACLSPYNVVINATHAEYYSERMMDATEDYLAGGGRLMYLSGNGYYWVVAFPEDDLDVMEVRRLDVGSRAWNAAPGEHYMASNGERGGLWRARGRAPQKLLGTGFISEGMDESKPYRRMPDSEDSSVSWIFDGVEGELIGDFGLALDGAAGVEFDRYDLSLGTPPHTKILASSEGHSDNYPLVVEEIAFNYPGMGGTQDYRVRADMTYFTTLNNGAVWSASSIAWGQSLPWNEGNNNVSQVMANVLDAFMKEGPLPGGD